MPSSKRKSTAQPVAKQQQLEQLPVLKKPLEQIGEGILEEGEAGPSGAGPSDLSQACACKHQTVFFAAIEHDHLPLCGSPSEPFFSRTPTPTSPRSPATYSSR